MVDVRAFVYGVVSRRAICLSHLRIGCREVGCCLKRESFCFRPSEHPPHLVPHLLTSSPLSMEPQRRGLMTMDPSPLREIGQKANIRRTVTTSVLTISPPKKTAAGKDQAPTPTVQLMQFQPKQVLEFGDVELGTGQTRNLLLFNPSSGPQGVEFLKAPSAEKGFRSDTVFPSIFPGESIKIPFHWEPQKEGKVFESVLLTTTDGHRLQISLTGNCFRKVAKVVRRGPNRRGALAQPSKAGAGHPIRRVSTYTVTKGPRPSEIGDVRLDPDDELMKRRHAAALLIQSAWRGFSVRRKLIRMLTEAAKRQEQERSAIMIQSYWRGYCARSLLSDLKLEHVLKMNQQKSCAATKIQSVWRGYWARKMFRERKAIEEAKRRVNAAIRIQSVWRGYCTRTELKLKLAVESERNQAAVVIQSHWRAYCVRKIVSAMRAIVIEQERVRLEKLEQERLRQMIEAERHVAAIVIQSHWRAYCARCLVSDMKAAIAAHVEQERNRAATRIQSVWRGYCAREKVFQQIKAIEEAKRRVNAATRIQSVWRGYCTRTELKLKKKIESERNQAAVVIQSHWRAYCARKLVSSLIADLMEQRRMNRAAILIQCVWRGYVTRKEIAHQKEEADRIERERLQQVVNAAALLIQSTWRGYSARQKYRHMLAEAAKLEEERVRLEQLEQERLRQVIEAERHAAAIVIQSNWRAYYDRCVVSDMKAAKRQDQERCAIIIQSYWRGYCARSLLSDLKLEHVLKVNKQRNCAATKIQSAWRGYRTRKEVFQKNKAIEEAKRRVSENKRNASPSMTLAARTSSALDALLKYKSLQKLSDHLKSLETSTRMSGECCKAIASPPAIRALLTILKSCNRSEPVKLLTGLAMDILINLAKNDETRAALVATPNFMDDIIYRAKVFASSDAILVHVLTIVWILISKDKIQLKVEARKNLTSILDGIKRKAEVGKVKLPNAIKADFKPYRQSHKRSAQRFKTKYDAYVAFMALSF